MILNKNLIEAKQVQMVSSQVEALDFFYNKENHKAPWDYKEMDRWNEDINAEYPGLHGKFIFRGEVIDAEIFGNLHYGNVGTAMGFEPELLYVGGGYAKCGINFNVLIGPNHCDDPNEHEAIKKGIEMFNNE